MRKNIKDKKTNVNIKRLLFIGVSSTVIIFLLIFRLFYIQVIQHDLYTREVNKQRQINIPINSGRGIVLDRNNIPLTDRKEVNIAIIFPQLFIIDEENLNYLMEITHKDQEELIQRISSSNYPIEIPIGEEMNWEDRRVLTTRGLFIIGKRQRYEDYPLLSHVVGYINQVDKKGMAGIEKALDHILMGNPTEILAATLDGRKRLLPGEGYSVVNSPINQKDVRLTIDYYLQKTAEEVMDRQKRDGAIVISDVETGDILALVSRPNYNPNTIAQHIKSSGDELYNKAIQMTFPPGSIFKIIVAAEAIERGIVDFDDTFYCNGSEIIGNVEIGCNSHKNGGNGDITFKEAFAESCNSTFIQIGQKLGANSIIEMAEKLGLNDKVGIGLQEEETGNLPSGEDLLGPAIGNISIGQGNIEVTPLQINQLTQIIANKGIKNQLHLLKDVLDNYNIVETFDVEEQSRVLSQKTAIKLQQLMESVMTEGTGRNTGDLTAVTAGKTGSAQSSKRGETVVHAWFTGYYPNKEPKYSITIFIQEGGSGGGVAVPIFKEILENIIDLGY
ncbi:peptidoglycan glycosyltransferase/penicillin-binding protein 2 [Anaerovirgula multivorans]|uniref:Peptidoglycan glycosyltransferase/penicillin-binding protein 2 n=1 Tax=Anaerovirgula multivorans TaxID=312168 RepID=A0A238ZPW4_9FIRM|nr:penicillin-binding transpeptidase domain-containing protein [Anaerovirgula multivorans]SNR85182.1 peptidoglycan glycosyltransferase/penicillin-binding protein 2 [Anaerovirgula multivorans]